VFGSSERAPPNTFMNARFTGCIWPSGITRQDSRNCYFIFVSVGTEEVSHRRVHGRSGVIASGRRPLTHGQLYFSISEAQFKVVDRGAALGSSTRVFTRNFWPSAVTS
jgi:hypothetical protein